MPEIKPEDVPSTVADMMENISVTYPKCDDDFPVPDIPVEMFKMHRIKRVYGKTSWTVGCRGSRYLLELCRFHRFPRMGRSESYSVSTGISISSASWTDAFKAPPARGKCRDLDASWSQVFRPRRNRDGITDFLNFMQSMLILWGEVFASAAAVVAPEAQQPNESLFKPDPDSQDPAEEASSVQRASPAQTVKSTQVPCHGQDVLQESEEDLISFD